MKRFLESILEVIYDIRNAGESVQLISAYNAKINLLRVLFPQQPFITQLPQKITMSTSRLFVKLPEIENIINDAIDSELNKSDRELIDAMLTYVGVAMVLPDLFSYKPELNTQVGEVLNELREISAFNDIMSIHNIPPDITFKEHMEMVHTDLILVKLAEAKIIPLLERIAGALHPTATTSCLHLGKLGVFGNSEYIRDFVYVNRNHLSKMVVVNLFELATELAKMDVDGDIIRSYILATLSSTSIPEIKQLQVENKLVHKKEL